MEIERFLYELSLKKKKVCGVNLLAHFDLVTLFSVAFLCLFIQMVLLLKGVLVVLNLGLGFHDSELT